MTLPYILPAILNKLNKRMENDNFNKKFNVRECADICPMGSPQKRLIDTMKGYIKKIKVWMSGKQGEWCMTGFKVGVFKGKYIRHSSKYEHLTLTRYMGYHGYMNDGSWSVGNPTTYRVYMIKSFFFTFLFQFYYLSTVHHFMA